MSTPAKLNPRSVKVTVSGLFILLTNIKALNSLKMVISHEDPTVLYEVHKQKRMLYVIKTN